jgi:hypothetical protein
MVERKDLTGSSVDLYRKRIILVKIPPAKARHDGLNGSA